jgi:glycine/D-amino acid oxidase-like deaminating enzyme/nitrite reductase/ring-hydroxylating ferredoxin subunit
MKLPHAPQSLWVSNHPSNALPQLAGDTIVDVAIIGAGITGLTAALHLRRAGKSVLVVDSHTVAEGVTGYTTGHLTEALDTRYTKLMHEFGTEGARLAAESTRAAIVDIEQIARLTDIPCGFLRVPGYLYTEGHDTAELEAELEAATRCGVRVALTNDVPFPFARTALRFEDQAEVHARDYVLGLARYLVHKGVRIHERTRCLHVHERTRHRVITDRGVVHAAHVVYATHTPLNRFALQSKLARYQSYVVAFAAQGPAPQGLFWDTADPYHYIRTQVVGDSTLLIVGGEDHRTGGDVDTTERYARLAQYAHTRFQVDSIHFMWSSQVIVPLDGLPYIGPSPHAAAAYVATGFAGNGLTFGTLAGRIVSDAILGRENPYATLYSPSRVPALTAVKDFVVDKVDLPLHMLGAKWRRVGAPSLESVQPGEGKIVRHAGELLGVYRDAEGKPHAVNPVCPHMGCVVKFNKAETTWDCPCHGSRFSVNGEVLTGPTTVDLATTPLDEEAPTVAPTPKKGHAHG